MSLFKNLLQKVPQFLKKSQNSLTDEKDVLPVYHDLFSKIEETTQTKLKEQDKILILKQIEQYSMHFTDQAKSDSHDHNLQLQIEQEEKNIMNTIRKLKSEISFSFLYDQYTFIKNNNHFEITPYIQCLSDQKEASSKISYVTQINSSKLYGLTQQECSKQFYDEFKIKEAIKALSDKEFLNFFFEFYFDLIIDLLYRRIPLTSLLKQVQSQVLHKCLQNLNVSNLLTLVFERLNLIDKMNLGQILSCSYQSIPIFYKIGETQENQIYKNNLISAFYSLMDQFQDHIVVNICSRTIEKRQREEFFNYLSNNKDIIADLKEGFNQKGTIHLYSQFSNSKLSKFLLFDISQLDILDIQFLKIFINLINCSSVILIHLNFEKDFILYANKYVASVEVQKVISTLNQRYFVIFIIHKAQKHRNQIEKYFKQYLEYHKFKYELLLISESDSESEYDTLFTQLKQSTFQQVKSQETIQSFEDFLEVYLSKSDLENLNTHITQYKKLIQQKIKEQLQISQIRENEQHKLIQHMFSYSNMFSELFYEEKIFDNLSRSYFRETENFVKKGEKLQLLKKKFESCNQLSQTTLFFFKEITSNNFIKMSVISKILSDWKQPMVEENNKKIDQINQEIRNLEKVALKQNSIQDQNNLEQLYKQKNELIVLQDNYDISVESFIREISLFTQNNTKSNQSSENAGLKVKIENYYQYVYQKGIPIQFIDKTRKFGSNLLEQFFKQIDQKSRLSDYKIVSVVGPQSSAKSTLMNYLFRCSFETSSARCTKGMYFTKINFQGMNLLVIDTEGLLSNIFRDQSFDNSVMTLLFLISHVIIFNIKDESNSKMKEMMNITEEVIKLFNNIENNFTLPEVFIALRDYFDRNNIESKKKQIINEMIQVNGIFESQSSKQQNKNQIKLKPENIFIFPSAFSELNHFDSRFKHINTGFGEDILHLRQSITNALKQSKGYPSIQDFYQKAEQIWNRLKEHGHDLLKCITLQEYQSKKKLEEIAIEYQKEIYELKIKVIEEKEAELKNSLVGNYLDSFSLNRIKEEYKQFIITQNQQMNEELENKLSSEYNDNKLINQLSPSDFNFILNKIQHRNKVYLDVKQNIFEQRIQSLFFGLQIDILEKDFNNQIQKEVNQAQFEQNEQTLKKLLDQIKNSYDYKIKQLHQKFETTDELMRQQLYQLKNEQQYDQNLQSLIQEFNISQMDKQNFEDKTNITQKYEYHKKFLINSSKLSQNEQELLISQIYNFFQGLSIIKWSKCYQEQEIVKKILQQTIELCQKFFDQIQPYLLEYINHTNIKKYAFYQLYQIIKVQLKQQQQQVLLKKRQKFQNIIDQKIQYIKKVSETSTDWVEIGIQAMQSIQNKIVRKFISKSLSNMEPVLNKTVDDLTSDYTKAIDNAFQSVYDYTEKKINIDNFLKYTVNINKYIDEMKRDQIKIKADELVENKTTEFNLGLQNIIDDLNEIILYFVNTPIFDFDQLIEKLNSIYFEGDSLQLGQEIIIENIKNKPQFIEEEVELEDEDQNFNQEIEDEENQDILEMISCNRQNDNNQQDKNSRCQINKDNLIDEVAHINDNEQKENDKEILAVDSTEILEKVENQSKEQENNQNKEQLVINLFSSQTDIQQDQNKQESMDSFIIDLNGSAHNDQQDTMNLQDLIENTEIDKYDGTTNLCNDQNEKNDCKTQSQQNNFELVNDCQQQEQQHQNQKGDEQEEQIQDLCGEEKNQSQQNIQLVNDCQDQKLHLSQKGDQQEEQIQDLCGEEQKQDSTIKNVQKQMDDQQNGKNYNQDQSDKFENPPTQENDNKNEQNNKIQINTDLNQQDQNDHGDDRGQLLKNNQKDLEVSQERQEGKQRRTSSKQQFINSEPEGKYGCQIEKARVKKFKKVKKQIPIQQLYIQGMRKIYNEINPTNSNKIILQFKEELNNELEQMLNFHYQKMIGCQERCPFCGQKCHLELGHSGDHNVNNRHLIIGIHGYGKSEFYVSKFCHDTIDEPFRINFQRYQNMYEASQKLFPNWSSCFSLDKKDNYDQNFAQILKQGYALTAKWFSKKNNKKRLEKLKEDVPQEFKDLAQNQEEIDEKYIIQWKYSNDQNNESSSSASEEESLDEDTLIQLKLKLLFLKFINFVFES